MLFAHFANRVADAIENRGPAFVVAAVAGELVEPLVYELGEVAETRVALELGDQRLRLGEFVRQLVQLVEAQIEQPVAGEEIATTRYEDVFVVVGFSLECDLQFFDGFASLLGRPRVEHHDDRLVQDREKLAEGFERYARRCLWMNDAHRIDVDAEVQRGVHEQRERGEQADRTDPRGACANLRNPTLEHTDNRGVDSIFRRTRKAARRNRGVIDRGSRHGP